MPPQSFDPTAPLTMAQKQKMRALVEAALAGMPGSTVDALFKTKTVTMAAASKHGSEVVFDAKDVTPLNGFESILVPHTLAVPTVTLSGQYDDNGTAELKQLDRMDNGQLDDLCRTRLGVIADVAATCLSREFIAGLAGGSTRTPGDPIRKSHLHPARMVLALAYRAERDVDWAEAALCRDAHRVIVHGLAHQSDYACRALLGATVHEVTAATKASPEAVDNVLQAFNGQPPHVGGVPMRDALTVHRITGGGLNGVVEALRHCWGINLLAAAVASTPPAPVVVAAAPGLRAIDLSDD